MSAPPPEKSLAERVADDLGGAFAVGLAHLGDKLGLFVALAAGGPVTSEELAQRAGLQERYVREWLKAMVASRYVEHQPDDDTYSMTDEQRAVLAEEGGRTFMGGAFPFALESLLLTPRLASAFQHGGGISFGELPAAIPAAIDRMHRPWFQHLLVSEWIAGVAGLTERLAAGIRALDVGCGLGRSTVALARAYPRSTFVGLDPDAPSIREARRLAAEAGAANATFVPASVEALDADADRFELIVAIDCVHDMVDPVGALRAMRALLVAGGQVFWSEPTGSREPMENRNAQGRLRANLSPYHCLTVSLAAGGAALGTIIGEAGARELAAEAGFARFDRLPIRHPSQQFFLLGDG